MIQVRAEATVVTPPDRAELDIGVVTQSQRSQEAASENARRARAVLDRLRKAVGPTASLKSINYSLAPSYEHPQAGGEPKLIGYTATNVIRVTLDDLTRVGTVIDAATKAGANTIQRIHFTLEDPQEARTQALREAALKARAQVESLAATLGVTIVRIHSVTETPPTVPMDAMVSRSVSTPETPVVAGTLEITASVTLAVEIAEGAPSSTASRAEPGPRPAARGNRR